MSSKPAPRPRRGRSPRVERGDDGLALESAHLLAFVQRILHQKQQTPRCAELSGENIRAVQPLSYRSPRAAGRLHMTKFAMAKNFLTLPWRAV
jgi:hypothetical protein